MFYYPILLQDKEKLNDIWQKQHTFLCLIVVFDYMARRFFLFCVFNRRAATLHNFLWQLTHMKVSSAEQTTISL